MFKVNKKIYYGDIDSAAAWIASANASATSESRKRAKNKPSEPLGSSQKS